MKRNTIATKCMAAVTMIVMLFGIVSIPASAAETEETEDVIQTLAAKTETKAAFAGEEFIIKATMSKDVTSVDADDGIEILEQTENTCTCIAQNAGEYWIIITYEADKNGFADQECYYVIVYDRAQTSDIIYMHAGDKIEFNSDDIVEATASQGLTILSEDPFQITADQAGEYMLAIWKFNAADRIYRIIVEDEDTETEAYEIRTKVGETFSVGGRNIKDTPVLSSDNVKITDTERSSFETTDEETDVTSEVECTTYNMTADMPGTYVITLNYTDGAQTVYTVYVTYALSEESEELFDKLKESWPENMSAAREELVRMALSGIGNITYNYGEASGDYTKPEADVLHCSQFVSWVYYQCGFTDFGWTRAAQIQNRDDVTNISYDELMPGDIGSCGKEDGTGHCGIYLGTIDGTDYWCHSSTSNEIDGVRADAYKNFNTYSVYNMLLETDTDIGQEETAIKTDDENEEAETDEDVLEESDPVIEDEEVVADQNVFDLALLANGKLEITISKDATIEVPEELEIISEAENEDETITYIMQASEKEGEYEIIVTHKDGTQNIYRVKVSKDTTIEGISDYIVINDTESSQDGIDITEQNEVTLTITEEDDTEVTTTEETTVVTDTQDGETTITTEETVTTEESDDGTKDDTETTTAPKTEDIIGFGALPALLLAALAGVMIKRKMI